MKTCIFQLTFSDTSQWGLNGNGMDQSNLKFFLKNKYNDYFFFEILLNNQVVFICNWNVT